MKRSPLPPRKTQLKRYARISPVSRKRLKRSGRPGKAGIVRLYGKDLRALRRQCFERDRFRCVICGCLVAWDRKEAEDLGLPVGEMAHKKTKRNNGDTLDNVETMCRADHSKSHNCGGKPLPKKARGDGKYLAQSGRAEGAERHSPVDGEPLSELQVRNAYAERPERKRSAALPGYAPPARDVGAGRALLDLPGQDEADSRRNDVGGVDCDDR